MQVAFPLALLPGTIWHCTAQVTMERTFKSKAESYASRRSRCRTQRLHPGTDTAQNFPMPWPGQWQVPTQWLFWTLWAFHQAQGSYSRRSLSVASGRREPPPPSLIQEQSCGMVHSTEPATNPEASAPRDPLRADSQEQAPVPARASSSSSPDEAMAGTSAVLALDDSRANHELLQRMART